MVIVDGSNVAHARKLYGKPMIENLKLVLNYFESLTEVDVLIKATLLYQIDNRPKLEKLIREGLIIQIPSNFDDDRLILILANEYDDYILSNDKFREYKEFPKTWVDKHRIEYVIIRNKLYLSKNILFQDKNFEIPMINEEQVMIQEGSI